VSDELHTVTVIDATTDDIELLVNLCQLGNELYNVYLYKTEMNQPDWITQAVQKSSAVIDVHRNNETFCYNEKTFYYGEKTFLSPATKVKGILDYFVQRQQEHK
jgi:predicted kinase